MIAFYDAETDVIPRRKLFRHRLLHNGENKRRFEHASFCSAIQHVPEKIHDRRTRLGGAAGVYDGIEHGRQRIYVAMRIPKNIGAIGIAEKAARPIRNASAANGGP